MGGLTFVPVLHVNHNFLTEHTLVWMLQLSRQGQKVAIPGRAIVAHRFPATTSVKRSG